MDLFKIDEKGIVIGAKQQSSPNFDARPWDSRSWGFRPWDSRPYDFESKKSKIDLLVIHCISLPPGEFGGSYVDDFFLNRLDSSAHQFFETIKDLKVSSHLFIDRSGEVIQYVSLNDRAWHAGKSIFQEREKCNDFSIGVELEGTDSTPFSDEQYESLIKVSKAITKSYPDINKDRIVGHSDIAPGRKTDPGPFFDWDRYLKGVFEE